MTQKEEETVTIPEDTKNQPEQRHINENQVENVRENEENLFENSENESSDSLYEDAGSDESEVNDEVVNSRYNLRRERRPNSKYTEYEMDMDKVLVSITEDDEINCYEDAMASENSDKWKQAMQAEISALEENETWFLVKSEDIKNKVIECKWVYKRKRDEFGNETTYKARLVARGFQQSDLYNIDIYSPVAKLPSVRIFLALCNHLNYQIFQLDVCSAFLNGEITQDVYIKLPKGFGPLEGKVVKLKKSLYGLKASPKNWYMKFNELMLSLNFVHSENEYCIRL